MTESKAQVILKNLERYTAKDVYLPLLPKQREAAEKASKEMLACDCGFGEYYCDWNHCKYNIHA